MAHPREARPSSFRRVVWRKVRRTVTYKFRLSCVDQGACANIENIISCAILNAKRGSEDHILAWLVARPCLRLSCAMRLSLRIDILIGRGIPSDRATFVLCLTQDLIRDEGEVRVRREAAWEVRMPCRHSLSGSYIAGNNGQLLVRKEKVGGSYAAPVRILRQNDEFVWIFLYAWPSQPGFSLQPEAVISIPGRQQTKHSSWHHR